jgi:hypothetical protein
MISRWIVLFTGKIYLLASHRPDHLRKKERSASLTMLRHVSKGWYNQVSVKLLAEPKKHLFLNFRGQKDKEYRKLIYFYYTILLFP